MLGHLPVPCYCTERIPRRLDPWGLQTSLHRPPSRSLDLSPSSKNTPNSTFSVASLRMTLLPKIRGKLAGHDPHAPLAGTPTLVL